MSTSIRNTYIQIGRTADPALFFAPDCRPGDWRDWRVSFQNPFPSNNVRVIVTPNDRNLDPVFGNPAVVGLVSEVDRSGFTLSARNSDCASGEAGFYFMAVEELSQAAQSKPVDLRFGIVQPRHFCPDCRVGDWNVWLPRFSSPFPPGLEYAALVTGCNLNVTPFVPQACGGPIVFGVGPDGGGSSGPPGRPTPTYYYNAPAVGLARNVVADGFELAARNSCCTQGTCAFYYVAAVEAPNPEGRFWIDSGDVKPKWFEPACKDGSWASWEVSFSKPFSAPPVVLLTCMEARSTSKGEGEAESSNTVAVLGLAQDVTTHGFTLAGFNTDCAEGVGAFYWVAIGCGLGCG